MLKQMSNHDENAKGAPRAGGAWKRTALIVSISAVALILLIALGAFLYRLAGPERTKTYGSSQGSQNRSLHRKRYDSTTGVNNEFE